MSVSEIPIPPLELPGVPSPALGSRALFPSLSFDSFLAHAAIAPTNMASTRAAQECLQDVASGGAAVFPRWMAQRERLRSKIADVFASPLDGVALTAGCTKGITDIALGLPWKSDETLVTFDGEFPANVIPWQAAASRAGGRVRMLPMPSSRAEGCGGLILQSLRDAILDGERSGKPVRYVAVSAVEFQTGLRLPLEEIGQICRESEAFFLVDGIQAAGVVSLDVQALQIDAFAAGAHKWLMSPEGTGFLVLSERLLESIEPATVGWLSYENSERFLFQGRGNLRYDRERISTARVFEGSTCNSVGFAALEGGFDVCRVLSPDRIYNHIQSLHDDLEPLFLERGFSSLRSVDDSLRSCILSFQPPENVNVTDLSAALRERGVMISVPDGCVRISPHFSNGHHECQTVSLALDAALKSIWRR